MGSHTVLPPMLARWLAAVLVLTVVPSAIALVPATPVDGIEVVNGHSSYDFATRAQCSSYDGILGLTSTDVTSTFSHAPAAGGLTTYTFHLDATLAEPVSGRAACDAVDFTFTSALAWPPAGNGLYASFTSPCGATGSVVAYGNFYGKSLQLYFSNPPSACGIPVANGVVALNIQALHPQTAYVCEPVAVSLCAGAYEWTYSGPAICGSRDVTLFAIDVAGEPIVYGQRDCSWQDGQEHSQAGAALGLVYVDTTATTCRAVIVDPFGMVGDVSTDCPEQVRAPIYAQDWAHVLP